MEENKLEQNEEVEFKESPENIPLKDSTNSKNETLDDSVNEFSKNVENSFSNDDFMVEVPSAPVQEMSSKAKNKGLKVFISIICFMLALSIALGTGYFFGINKNKNTIGSLQLNDKPSNDKILSTEAVYNLISPSVVGIKVYNSEGVKGYASGVVYSEDGYIITNDHIYEDVPDAMFKIYDYSGKSFDAKYIAGDVRSDLAVLKINADGFFPAAFGNSDQIGFGEDVVAIGRPSSPTDSSSITKGIISYPNRRVSNSLNYSTKLIQTDSAINPGSSGGALVNMFGQVIGITSSKLVGSSYEGIGYAIPTVTVKKVVESLIKNGTVVNRARLGFTYQQIDELSNPSKLSKYGLLVVSVTDDSDMKGKVSAGDIIVAVNGEQILTDDVLINALDLTLPGEIMTFDIITKSGAQKQIKVKVLQDSGTSSYQTNEKVEDIPLLPQ